MQPNRSAFTPSTVPSSTPRRRSTRGAAEGEADAAEGVVDVAGVEEETAVDVAGVVDVVEEGVGTGPRTSAGAGIKKAVFTV